MPEPNCDDICHSTEVLFGMFDYIDTNQDGVITEEDCDEMPQDHCDIVHDILDQCDFDEHPNGVDKCEAYDCATFHIEEECGAEIGSHHCPNPCYADDASMPPGDQTLLQKDDHDVDLPEPDCDDICGTADVYISFFDHLDTTNDGIITEEDLEGDHLSEEDKDLILCVLDHCDFDEHHGVDKCEAYDCAALHIQDECGVPEDQQVLCESEHCQESNLLQKDDHDDHDVDLPEPDCDDICGTADLYISFFDHLDTTNDGIITEEDLDGDHLSQEDRDLIHCVLDHCDFSEHPNGVDKCEAYDCATFHIEEECGEEIGTSNCPNPYCDIQTAFLSIHQK